MSERVRPRASDAPVVARPALDATLDAAAATPALLWVLLAVPAALVLAGIALVAAEQTSPGIPLIVLGVVIVVLNGVFGAPDRLLTRLTTRPVDERREAGLINLVEGLGVAAGVVVPDLAVIEDPAANAVVMPSSRGALLITTTGLLDRLDRIELEAVIAHELTHLRRNEVSRARLVAFACGTLLALWPGSARLVAHLCGDEREVLADLAAMRITRYPPALASALEALRATPVRPAHLDTIVARASAGWWFAPLAEAEARRVIPGRLDLELRAAALREL